MDTIVEQITAYVPWNEQEERDKELILSCLKGQENLFLRENATAHMTASAWVLNQTRDKLLMVYHLIYHSWSWVGGHADGEKNLLSVALREAKEESGLEKISPISEDIFSIESLTVDGHEKHGHYVSSHLHLNCTYLLQADDKDPLRVKPDENRGVAWFPVDEAAAASSESWFRERIYSKLNAKLLERHMITR